MFERGERFHIREEYLTDPAERTDQKIFPHRISIIEALFQAEEESLGILFLVGRGMFLDSIVSGNSSRWKSTPVSPAPTRVSGGRAQRSSVCEGSRPRPCKPFKPNE